MEPDHGSFSEGTHLDVPKLDGTNGNRSSATVRAVKDIAFGSVSSSNSLFLGIAFNLRI